MQPDLVTDEIDFYLKNNKGAVLGRGAQLILIDKITGHSYEYCIKSATYINISRLRIKILGCIISQENFERVEKLVLVEVRDSLPKMRGRVSKLADNRGLQIDDEVRSGGSQLSPVHNEIKQVDLVSDIRDNKRQKVDVTAEIKQLGEADLGETQGEEGSYNKLLFRGWFLWSDRSVNKFEHYRYNIIFNDCKE